MCKDCKNYKKKRKLKYKVGWYVIYEEILCIITEINKDYIHLRGNNEKILIQTRFTEKIKLPTINDVRVHGVTACIDIYLSEMDGHARIILNIDGKECIINDFEPEEILCERFGIPIIPYNQAKLMNMLNNFLCN